MSVTGQQAKGQVKNAVENIEWAGTLVNLRARLQIPLFKKGFWKHMLINDQF